MYPQDAEQPVPIAHPLESKEPTPAHSTASKLSPWEALLEVGFVLFLLLAPTIVRYLFTRENILDQAEKGGISPYWQVFINGTLAMAMVAFILHKDRHSFKSLGLFFKDPWLDLIISGMVLFGIYALQVIIVFVLAKVQPEWMETLGKQRTEMIHKFPVLSPGFLLLFTLFVGFYEEVLFRGFLITRLKIATKSAWWAVVISSVIFAIVHYFSQDQLAVVQIFIIALILGGLFILRGNLISPILVHAGFDFISLISVFILSKLPPEKLKELMPELCTLILGYG